jgi:hypothetical protein
VRRRILALAAAPAIALLAMPRDARAQDRGGSLGSAHRTFESPQHFAMELRFSPYRPDIDSDPALSNHAPYAAIFGTTPRILVAAELDWQVVRIPHLGTFGPGLSAGYTSMSAAAPLRNPPPAPASNLSGEQTSLSIYPFYAVAVLRADVFMREANIPLVPYVKAGLGYALWRASNDNGTSNHDNVAGKGHSYGTQLALGLSLHLNAFDAYAAKEFDNTMGVNHTYLFFEYFSSNFSTLGPASQLRVGATTWAMGLAVEF